MEDQTSDDWLPPGWKVEVRQRRNGKKDKCYYAPCGELRFISRAEVVRYLEKCGSKTEEKEKVPSKQSSKNQYRLQLRRPRQKGYLQDGLRKLR